jgi:hypothetical protein
MVTLMRMTWSATEVRRRFAIAGVPSYVLVDTEGRIAAYLVGLPPFRGAEFSSVLPILFRAIDSRFGYHNNRLT